jgi:hypothetical protein
MEGRHLPASIGNMEGLVALDLEGCKITGPVPGSIKSLSKLKTFQIAQNDFTSLPALDFKQYARSGGGWCDVSGNSFSCPLPQGAVDCHDNDGAPSCTAAGEAFQEPVYASPSAEPHCITVNDAGWGRQTAGYIQDEIRTNGPVTASLAICESFHHQINIGTLDEPVYDTFCNSGSADFIGYHAVVIVGWGESDGTPPHWEVKNSWGAGWNGNGHFRIRRGTNLAGIEGEVCNVGSAFTLRTMADSPPSAAVTGYPGQAKFWPPAMLQVVVDLFAAGSVAGWTTVACGFANNDTNQVFSAPSTQCDSGATRKSGGWNANSPTNTTKLYHPGVHAAVHHVVAHMHANASASVLAAHSQSVAGTNRRVLMIAGGDIVEARVHRNLAGRHSLLAEPIKHSCATNASCTAHPDCCTGGTAAACGACIATKMNAELQPPAQQHGDMDSGAPVGALVGGGVVFAACIGAALMLWRKRIQQRETRALEIGAPAQSL